MGYLMILSVSRVCSVGWWDEWCVWKDVEECSYSLIEVLSLHFPRETEENHKQISVTIPSIPAKIWMKHHWSPLDQSVQSYFLVPCKTVLNILVHRFYRNDESSWIYSSDLHGELPQPQFPVGCWNINMASEAVWSWLRHSIRIWNWTRQGPTC